MVVFVLFFQVHHLVAIELAYINTKHPDFSDAAQVSASVNSQQVGLLLGLPSDLTDLVLKMFERSSALWLFVIVYAVLAVNSQGHFTRTFVQNVVLKAAQLLSQSTGPTSSSSSSAS